MCKWIICLSLIGFSTLAHADPMASEQEVRSAIVKSSAVKFSNILEKTKESIQAQRNLELNGMLADLKLGNTAAQNYKETKIALRF